METTSERPGRITAHIVKEPCEREELVSLFKEVAAEQGWQPGGQIAARAGTAVHFALRVGGALAGGLQVVLPDAGGRLSCQDVWPEVPLSGSCAHVTVLCIRQGYRGPLELFWTLCQELWCWCADRGIQTLFLESTPRMEALYRRMGLPLRAVGELRVHWGEPCILAAVDVATVAGTVVLRARRSPLFRALVDDALRRSA